MSVRILILSTTSSVVGGVETWIDRACNFLVTRGFDPVVGLARGQKSNNPEKFRKFHPALNTVEVDGRGLNSEGRIRALMRCIRRVRPSIVFPMSLVEANDAAIRCKQQGDDVRLVIHAQGNLPAMLADLRHYRPGIDHVVCPGKLTRKLLTTWGGFDEQQVTHIPNGADLATHSRLPSSGGILRLGYVGRFTRGDKRVLDLIDLHRQLTDRQVPFFLTVVGDGPARDTLHEAFSDRPDVSLRSPMSHDELYKDVFPGLDVLVLCSASEAFGIVLAEAMMNGVVPVTSRYLGYHSEQLVVHEETGLSYEIGDMAEAAVQIQRLAANRNLLTAISERCRRHARGNYTWERSLSGWHSLLQGIAAERAKPVAADLTFRDTAQSGRLDSLNALTGLTDLFRRGRRFLFGSPVPPGGEEWPLFCRTHPPDVLKEISESCHALDQPLAVAESRGGT